MNEPIPVDEAVILAAQRAATGANIHAISSALYTYRSCSKCGAEYKSRLYRYALILLTKGEITNEYEALRKAEDFFSNARKEEMP